MFSFFNMFMLRSLFIRSFFILFLPLSAGFAMQAMNSFGPEDFNVYGEKANTPSQNINTQSNINNNNMLEDCSILANTNKEIKNTQCLRLNSSNMGNSVYQGGETKKEKYRGDFTGYKNVKPDDGKINEGEEESEDEYSKDGQVPYYDKYSEFETVFRQPRATVGFFEGNDNYSKYALMDSPKFFIFFYRRGTFLFFCPLLFNSLLNFIFEIDNKPSGGFFNFFSVGWRTLPFFGIITFDIHFNWFLFAVSAWFDFVYFISFIRNEKLFSDGFNRQFFIPMLLCSFVFDAVSLCVNFKVDDYFYITVNLSYFLQRIVGGLFCQPLEEDLLSIAPTVSGPFSNDKRGESKLEYNGKDNINIKNVGVNMEYNCGFNEEDMNNKIIYKNNCENNFDNNVYFNNNNNGQYGKYSKNNRFYSIGLSNVYNQNFGNKKENTSLISSGSNQFVDKDQNDMNQFMSQNQAEQNMYENQSAVQNSLKFNENNQNSLVDLQGGEEQKYQGGEEEHQEEQLEEQYSEAEQQGEEQQYSGEEGQQENGGEQEGEEGQGSMIEDSNKGENGVQNPQNVDEQASQAAPEPAQQNPLGSGGQQ